jgi:hypothetical protein
MNEPCVGRILISYIDVHSDVFDISLCKKTYCLISLSFLLCGSHGDRQV